MGTIARKVQTDAKRDELINESAKNATDTSATDSPSEKNLTSKYATPYWYQFRHVTHRTSLIFYRDPDYIAAKVFLMTIAGLFIGFTFFGLKHTKTGAQMVCFVPSYHVLLLLHLLIKC